MDSSSNWLLDSSYQNYGSINIPEDMYGVPHDLNCPITYEIFKDPVTYSSGITFDRAAMQAHARNADVFQCPVTRSKLTEGEHLYGTNRLVQAMVQKFLATRVIIESSEAKMPEPSATDAVEIEIFEDSSSSLSESLHALFSSAAPNHTPGTEMVQLERIRSFSQ